MCRPSRRWVSISSRPPGSRSRVRPSCPKPSCEKINREIIAAMSKPEVQARMRHDGMITEVMSVEQLKHYIDTEAARWKPVLEQAGLIGN